MELFGSNLEERLDAYQKEARAIKRKLKNGAPKREKTKRLKDLEERLIPDLVRKIL